MSGRSTVDVGYFDPTDFGASQRVCVHRVGGRRPLKARQGRLALGAANPKARKLHLTTPERDPARGAPASPSPPIRLMPALRTAQRFSVRLHHRQKNLSTGPDTELVERLTRIEHHAQQGQRHVDRDRLRATGLVFTPVTTASVCFAMVASPSVGWHPCPTTGQVKESPPFSDQVQQPMGHPPLPPVGPEFVLASSRRHPAENGCTQGLKSKRIF